MQAIFRELCASKNHSVFYLECQKDVHRKKSVVASEQVCPAPGEASGIVAAVSFTAMRKVVEFKEMGMGALASTCGLGMALKAMADSEKNPILIDGALSLCNLLVAALFTRATPVLPRRCERV